MSTFVTVKEKTLARCRKMGSTISYHWQKFGDPHERSICQN